MLVRINWYETCTCNCPTDSRPHHVIPNIPDLKLHYRHRGSRCCFQEMHQGRLLSSLHLTATSINQLRERVELAGTDDASNNRLSSYTYRYAPASVSPQGFTTSTIPLTATGPTPEPAIAVASSEPSAASSLLITVDLFKNEGADGIEEKQQRSQDPETDETNPTPSGLPLVIDSHVKKEVLLQCFRQMRDWFKLLSYLTRPWKRWTKGQRQFLSHISW